MNDEIVAATTFNTDFADLEEGPSTDMSPHAEDFPVSGHWCHIAWDQSNK
jgi:hypothetical protein